MLEKSHPFVNKSTEKMWIKMITEAVQSHWWQNLIIFGYVSTASSVVCNKNSSIKRAIGVLFDLILKQGENRLLAKSAKRLFKNPFFVLDYTNKQLFYYIAQIVSKRNTICATCNKNAEHRTVCGFDKNRRTCTS